jgi:hypothetical protein
MPQAIAKESGPPCESVSVCVLSLLFPDKSLSDPRVAIVFVRACVRVCVCDYRASMVAADRARRLHEIRRVQRRPAGDAR